MTTTENLISNISYTNKDFNSIYPALLDLVKKITYRWDPSISNESDPGVILLKLNALIADKINYNIDKNVLECFPLSVTQDRNARQLYEQLGYYMHWRLAASVPVTMRWIGDTASNVATVRKFTMVTDADSEVVYTLVDDMALPLDGTYITFNALQGIAVNYSINGSTLITAENLDSNNRLYFDYNDVAENGIFIRNSFAVNYSDWKKVDNLYAETVSANARNYSFGVTQDTNVCYIEFPSNAQEIIDEGIYITYIKTDGYAGNIAPYTLEKFYNDTYAWQEPEDVELPLNSDNVQLTNFIAATDGEDPETINDAYRNYKRTVGTFNTLVTLRDYINAIVEYEGVSNAFVCDKTNDLQVSYDVMSIVNGVDQYTTVSPNDLITPFDLKFYMLYAMSDSDNVMSYEQYNDTFKLIDSKELTATDTTLVSDAFSYINDKKHIAHNYYSVSALNPYADMSTKGKYKYGDNFHGEPTGSNGICLIKNRYPISGKIIPQYRLSTEQKNAVLNNVKLALINALNAQNVDFGLDVSYDYIYNTIVNADERIKSIALSDLTYETYAVYMDVGENTTADTAVYREIRIDQVDENYPDLSKKLRLDIATKSVLAGNTQLFIEDEDIYPQIGQNWEKIGTEYSKSTNYITTALNKPFEFDSADNTYTYNVAQNEAITLYAPNLVDVTEYTSYVRYEYKLNNNVPYSNSYMLHSDEYIAFYWTADQNDGYNYALYGEGSIIKPSFTLTAGEVPGGFPQELSNLLSSATAPKYVKGITATLTTPEDVELHISQLSTAGMVLSTTKTVTIQSTNQVELNHNDFYCSWILNKTDDDGYYELFDDSTTSYRLKNGEYFMYTNSTRTSLVVLGVGTLIERDSTWDNTSWTCAPYEYSSIVSSGLDALINTPAALQRIPEGHTVTVTEMQFITLNNESILKLTARDELSPAPEIDSTQDILLTPTNYTKIEYKGKLDTDFIEIPSVMVNNQNWTLNSQLNLNITKLHAQLLTSGQSMTLKSSDSDSGSIISPDNVNTQRYVFSSHDIVMEGGEDVNVSYINSAGDLELPKMSTYFTYDSTDEVIYSEDGVTTIKLSRDIPSQTLQMRLPEGEYVLVFMHQIYTLDDLSIKYVSTTHSSGVLLHGIDDTETNLKEPRTHYLGLSVASGDSTQSLVITADFSGDDPNSKGSFSIRKCYKYTVNEDILGPDEPSVYENVKKLNVAHNFNYTYNPGVDKAVNKPLDGLSFFNTNHIYNSFTIPQLNTASLDDLYVTDIIRS